MDGQSRQTLLDALDFDARRIVMHAYLYYWVDSPVLSNSEFDNLCVSVIRQWDDLDSIKKWQLGGPHELRSTCLHVKITQIAENAARAWHERLKHAVPPRGRIPAPDWKYSAAFNVNYYSNG